MFSISDQTPEQIVQQASKQAGTELHRMHAGGLLSLKNAADFAVTQKVAIEAIKLLRHTESKRRANWKLSQRQQRYSRRT